MKPYKKLTLLCMICAAFLLSLPSLCISSDYSNECQDEGMEPYYNFTIVKNGKKLAVYDEWNARILEPSFSLQREGDNIISRILYEEKRTEGSRWYTRIKSSEWLAVCIDQYEVARTIRVALFYLESTRDSDEPASRR